MALPSVIDRQPRGAEPCASCGARLFSVCGAFPEHDLERLATVMTASRVRAGQRFVTEGDVADSFFNVTSGTVRLCKSLSDGRRQITGFVARGYFLGLAAGETYAFSAEAIDPVEYCRFSRRRLQELVDDFPALQQRLLAFASDELVAAQEQMLLLGRKTAKERVASFILARSMAGTPGDKPVSHLHLPMLRHDIADYLGLTIETVSRTLSRLQADGLIEILHLSQIVIRDRPCLMALAGGEITQPLASVSGPSIRARLI